MGRLSFKNRLFCKLGLIAGLIAATAYADEIRTGGARVIENPTQDGNLVLRVNDGGTKKDALTITGSTGDVVMGASGTGQTTPHVLRGYANDLVYPALRIQNEDTAATGTGVSVQFAQSAGAAILGEIQSVHMGSSQTDLVFKTQNSTLKEMLRLTGAGTLRVLGRQYAVTSGGTTTEVTSVSGLKNRFIQTRYTDLSTTARNFADGQSLFTDGGGAITFFLRAVSGQTCVFNVAATIEPSVAFRYSSAYGQTCTVTGGSGTYTISGLGDSRTYTLTCTAGSAICTLAIGSATAGETILSAAFTDLAP